MKRCLSAVVVLMGLMATPSAACNRAAVALALPLFIDDPYSGSAAQVLAAPVLQPVIVVPRPVFAPRSRVQVFVPQRRVRVFVR
jgi:hypothetical protein